MGIYKPVHEKITGDLEKVMYLADDHTYMLDEYGLKTAVFEREPKHIIDVGANFGWFALLVTEEYPSCNVYAYELMQENVNVFKDLHKESKNVKIFNAAVIGGNKVTSILQHPTNVGGHRALFAGNTSFLSEHRHIDKPKSNKVPKQITITEIISDFEIDYIDFLKMDCEGSEYEIFEYIFKNDLCGKILNLAMEVHGTTYKEYPALISNLREQFDEFRQIGNIVHCKNRLKRRVS
tara:strand:+ start:440 stop:1147 length:708 start_codon:yes stop_codon:yes gene_type:complete